MCQYKFTFIVDCWNLTAGMDNDLQLFVHASETAKYKADSRSCLWGTFF